MPCFSKRILLSPLLLERYSLSSFHKRLVTIVLKILIQFVDRVKGMLNECDTCMLSCHDVQNNSLKIIQNVLKRPCSSDKSSYGTGDYKSGKSTKFM